MYSVQHIDEVRAAEIEFIVPFLTPGARVLEIGAGTGRQAQELVQRGFQVTAIDLRDSNYAGDRVYPVIDYDGRTIPLPDASVDIVFSSNVLEHVPNLTEMHAEIRRVLRPGGYCIHVLPTHAWRFWTLATSIPDAFVYLFAGLPAMMPRGWPRGEELKRLGRAWYATVYRIGGRIYQRRHGERGNVISELWLFHPRWWRRNFAENGFLVLSDEPAGLFYTGNMLFGRHLRPAQRKSLASLLGSACHLFKLGVRT